MEEKLGLMSEKDFMIKSRLEVKLNDLEKKHLETKEREAQTVGFLERKLRQVELEHKTELKLRRQLRYEVNNLRKKLLETYQLYSNTLEQNELMRSEIDRLKGNDLKNRGKEIDFVVSKQVEVQIHGPFQDYYCFGNENSGLSQKNRLSLRGLNELDFKEKKFSMSFDAKNGKNSFNRGSLHSGKNLFSSINRTVERIKIPNEGRALGSAISGGESSRDLNLKSERAKDWLNQIEELYKPLEYPKLCNGRYKSKLDSFSRIGVENSLSLEEDSFSDEEYYSGEYDISENTEDVITNTGFIIDQINQQDKELSTLLNKTFISTNNKNRIPSRSRSRSVRNTRK
ncbi:uncharacterized protein cubi_02416 [Cryptosporidium ubiquitum]|uniref:Uncharacterized protein n=1 Tax=Cryptosporidium ubiquitum TaxID=857276 RepID=A0A1J4MG63_9CRYT|nr:uncharacterized protein cubi_02416 [Cryptosporidium ubiquitum]OII73184.1 hypothetical protein cubi_02416 [Cryptosporidium ubiquitum]